MKPIVEAQLRHAAHGEEPSSASPSVSPSVSPSPEFLDALGVAVYTTDATGILTSFNETAVELWGRRPRLGKDQWCGSWRLYFPDGRPMAHDECPMGVTLKEDRPVRGVEAIVERPDGTRRWFVPYPTPLHDPRGRLVGAVNVLVDVTERKQAELAAFHLNAVVTSSDDAIVSKDLNGIIKSWNQGAERIFGFTADEAIGRSILLIIPPDRQDEEALVLSRVRSGERVDHFETVRRRKDGSEIPISLTVSPVRDGDGQIIGASKIARDISERKLAERKIADALAVKDEFIGLVSHELRTPLTTILGNAAILARPQSPLGEEARLAAALDVHRSAVRLARIIDDLLSLARLEQEKIEREPVALARCVERVVWEYAAKSDRLIDLRVDGEPVIAIGDDSLVGHVVENYISNAEKYSPDDSVIEVVVDSYDAYGRVRVLDRGIGIDPTETEHLFETFYRSGNVGNVGGMGIGLAVCDRLIRAIDGTCWAAPRPGGGSEFGFCLPLYAPEEINPQNISDRSRPI